MGKRDSHQSRFVLFCLVQQGRHPHHPNARVEQYQCGYRVAYLNMPVNCHSIRSARSANHCPNIAHQAVAASDMRVCSTTCLHAWPDNNLQTETSVHTSWMVLCMQVAFVQRVAQQPELCTKACQFYRAEPGFLLQGACMGRESRSPKDFTRAESQVPQSRRKMFWCYKSWSAQT